MTFLATIPALLFGLTGLFAILFLIKSFLSALNINFKFNLNLLNKVRQRPINKKQLNLKKAKEFFADKKMQDCSQAIKESFYLNPPLINIKFLESVNDHNFEVLAFLVNINSTSPSRILILPELERLVQQRSQLHRNLAESYLTLDEVKRKRQSKGKQTPKWAISEFQAKIDDLTAELEVNLAETKEAIIVICKTIAQKPMPDDESVTYH